jgi:tRNA threonylcarbamoyladenosine biosynthesis protein TsaB
LAQGDVVLSIKYLQEPRTQATLLAPLVAQLLEEQQTTLDQYDAVAVSAGPGSYTGLRVGVSTAKGLCFGGNKPIIAVRSLQVIAQNCIDIMRVDCTMYAQLPQDTIIIPLMDARRMEVYTAQYTLSGEERVPAQAKIIDKDSFASELSLGTVIFTGDGVEKCCIVLAHPNARFVPLMPSAEGMRVAAYRAWQTNDFADLAYFEPSYLKEFVAGIKKPV